MPPNPEKNDRTQDTPGGPVQVHIAEAQDPVGQVHVEPERVPEGSLDKVKSKDLLDSLQQATVQSMGGTLVNSHDVEVGGLAGREFSATDPQGSEVTARVFVGGSQRLHPRRHLPEGGRCPRRSSSSSARSSRPPERRWVGVALRGHGAADAAVPRT